MMKDQNDARVSRAMLIAAASIMVLGGWTMIPAPQVKAPVIAATSIMAEATPAIEVEGEANACDAATAELQPALDDHSLKSEAEAAAGGGCKSCKGRPWCGCSYQGKPRISCNPCCYQGPTDPFPTCFD